MLLDHRVEVTTVMDAWAVDPDSLWVRRTAMLVQLRHAEDTDTDLLDRLSGLSRREALKHLD